MSSSGPFSPTVTTTDNIAPGSASYDGPHRHRRFFIGPMPEKVVSRKKGQVRKREHGLFRSTASHNADDEDEGLSRIVREHAFNFFIQEGGNAEDWGEDEERSTTEEMLNRWRNSEWGKILRNKRKETHQVSHWVGGSFEIGNFLGMNIIHKEAMESIRDGISCRNRKTGSSTATDHAQSSVVAETVVAATSQSAPNPVQHDTHIYDSGTQTLPTAENNDINLQTAISASSSTALPRSPPRENIASPPNTRPILRAMSSPAIKGDGTLGISDDGFPAPFHSLSKGKSRRLVHYSDSPNGETTSPVPPAEVLERTGSAVAETSAGATVQDLSQDDLQWGDVVMRDRMLVRVLYTKSESLGSSFNEIQNRTTCNLHYENWAEHMVVWRKDRIEIYEDYSIPWKEWIIGHKNLAFFVPLRTPRTHLSMYSFVDLTFCVTCPPTDVDANGSKTRSFMHHSRDGTNIFVFKVKSRTRALDWTWKLWRYLGGQIPPYIEVRNPALDVRVKLDMHQTSTAIFTRQNIIGLCMHSLRSVPDWDHIVQRRMADGKTLELAWRMEMKLDWVWQEDCVDGTERTWAALCGLALKQKMSTPYLEIRLGEHFPTSVHLQDGTRLQEAAAIEGYLDRIKPNSQAKQPVYLASHDGNLFYLTPALAHPPSPPGLHTRDNATKNTTTLRQEEVRRGSLQIMNAIGVSDLRDILAVRRAFQNVPVPSHKEDPKGDDDWVQIWTNSRPERSDSDDEDQGGDEELGKSGDKPRLRMKRAFELLLRSGNVVRFEAHSRRVALEWIDRLRDLISYWRQRHCVDAREEMDLAQGSRPRVTPYMHANQDESHIPPEAPADPAASLPALGSLYNWCVMDGCKPIVKGGKMFARRGLHGPYKMVQSFLVSGQLIQYHITNKSTLHKRQFKTINLLDAYICSGYFAAQTLPKGEYSPNAPAVPRRYQDGLETDDPEEDTLFIIWYRSKAPVVDVVKESAADDTALPPKRVPNLSSKRKLVIFRTRSKLERDAWCWALNCEIEKMVRLTKVRENKLRGNGGLVNF